MCSYQISEANFGNQTNENWEENLWAHVLSPSSSITSSDTSTSYSQVSDAAVEIFSEGNALSSTLDYQVNTSTIVQNAETQSSLPATLEKSTSAPQTTNMSTYFSTFNPMCQIPENSIHQKSAVITCARSQSTGTWHNKPQARINLVPASNGSFKAIVKRKRKRTVFTTEQIQVLEEVYSKKPYVTRDERQILVRQLQVNDKSVKIWFQNRRLKNKKGDNQDSEETNQCSIFDRIDTIEAKIKERTDEFGYVTLDDKIVDELVNVIDDYFTSNVTPVKCNREIQHSPIYEPISPASVSDNSCEENVPTWQYYGTRETVQELMDIESVITT